MTLKAHPRFSISLSIEMDEAAHRTLRLRGFLRKFSCGFPSEYYDFVNGLLSREPDWEVLYPKEWEKACDETLCLKLGASDEPSLVKRRIALVRELHGGRTVLLGGPPCQSYSVVGRSRNSGNAHYNADKDERQSLYQEYAGQGAVDVDEGFFEFAPGALFQIRVRTRLMQSINVSISDGRKRR